MWLWFDNDGSSLRGLRVCSSLTTASSDICRQNAKKWWIMESIRLTWLVDFTYSCWYLKLKSAWLTGLNSDLYNFLFLSSNSSLSWVDIFHIFRPVVKQVCRMWVGRNSWDGCFLHRILALCRSTSSKSSTKYVLHWFFYLPRSG